MRSLSVFLVTQRKVVWYRRFGTTCRSIFKSQVVRAAWRFLPSVRLFDTDVPFSRVRLSKNLDAWRRDPIGRPETSVWSHVTLRNNPEDGRTGFNRGGSLRCVVSFFFRFETKIFLSANFGKPLWYQILRKPVQRLSKSELFFSDMLRDVACNLWFPDVSEKKSRVTHYRITCQKTRDLSIKAVDTTGQHILQAVAVDRRADMA
jgi:hypothetical protein